MGLGSQWITTPRRVRKLGRNSADKKAAGRRGAFAMKDLTPTEAAAMCFTGGGRHAATALEAFTGQDLARALEYAIVMRLDGRRAEAELRELTGTAKPPTASMSTVQARQLARHLK